MHGFSNAGYFTALGLLSLIASMSFWFRDVIAEGTYIGNHTAAVQRGLNLGVALFIASEALFFLAIFWAFFHSALSPTVELGAQWPPLGINAINPFELPLLNTVILLSSGVTVTFAHHSLIQGNRAGVLYGLIATIILAIVFTFFQGVEYSVSSFTISDGAFGSCFYFGTGLTVAPVKLNISIRNYKFSRPGGGALAGEAGLKKLRFFSLKNINVNKGLSPYWVTGFADAESSFVVKIGKDTTRKFSLRIIPEFSIELHEKDISLIKQIQSFFGVGAIKIRIRAGRPTAIYSVQSLKNLTDIIIPHFKQYPMLTQKQADFELFFSVVNLMNQKEHFHLEGFTKIISIRASMNKGLPESLKIAFPNIIPILRPTIDSQVIKDPLWLVGFVDGEGCFYVKLKKNKSSLYQVSLAFSISQHSRDSSLLNIIKDYLGCGVIENVSTRPNITNFAVYKFSDLLGKIIPFFEKNPLLGTKFLDYQDFCKVIILKERGAHLTEHGNNKICIIKKGMNLFRGLK